MANKENKQQKIELSIQGMTCDSCAMHVEKALQSVSGAIHVRVPGWASGRATVEVSGEVSDQELTDAVSQAGYQAAVQSREAKVTHPSKLSLQQEGSTDFDLLIIGTGGAGMAAAIKGSELGARVAIVEVGTIGGTCVNVGCVPSKTLIRAAKAHHRARQHPFAGIESISRVVNFKAVIDQKRELIGEMRQGKYVDVLSHLKNVKFIQGRAQLISAQTVTVNGKQMTAEKIIVATGASPAIPPIPGLAESGYLTNETAFELEELPESLIVLGGRYVALEIAQMFARFGSRVTILQRSPRILPTEGVDLTDALTNYLEQEGIEVITGVKINHVRRDGNNVIVEAFVEGEKKKFYSSHILAALGRKPRTQGFGLEHIGIELDNNRFLKVKETLQTSVSQIFAAGDVIGEPMYVYTAAYEGALAAENALTGAAKKRDYLALPWVIFTDPQVAGVGIDEQQAKENGLDAESAVLLLEHVPRSLAARDTRGFIKLIRNRQTDQLIGARILAPEGSELLMEISLAIKYGITVQELASSFHPYLTLSEGVKLAAITFGKDVSKLSCCASN